MNVEPGLYPTMNFETYLELDAWGSSSLRAMRRGPPARVVWEKDSPSGDTSARLLGSAVHCGLLTPHLFADTYVGKPEGMRFSTKEGKAWRDAHSSRTILSNEDFLRVSSIVDALMAKEAVAKSLRDAACEHSMVWMCPWSGETCKGRPDWISGRWLYDLKVSRHADSGFIAHRAYAEGWLHQLAHYVTGAQTLKLDVSGGRLVVVTPAPPHYIYLLELKVDALDLLGLENVSTLKEMRKCREAAAWENTPDTWKLIEPPPESLVEFESVAMTDASEEVE